MDLFILLKASPFTGLGCDRAFCGAYWHAMGVVRSDVYPVCSHETLKPVSIIFRLASSVNLF